MRRDQSKRHHGRYNEINSNNHGKPGPRPDHRMQTFDSSGPDVKIRGNAHQLFERYLALAREAATAGDRIAAENLYQHAEHYLHIMKAREQDRKTVSPPPMTPADAEISGSGAKGGGAVPSSPRNVSSPQPFAA